MADSPLSIHAIEYTLRHLLRVAFPQSDSIDFQVKKTDFGASVQYAGVRMDIPLMDELQWKLFLSGEMKPVQMDSASGSVRILYFPHNDVLGNISCLKSEDSLTFPFDIISPSFALLSRYEEFYALRFDDYGRFPYKDSLAEKYDLVEIPLVDEYGLLIRQWLTTSFPEVFQAIPRKSHVVPTHDVDHLCRFTTRFQALRSIFGRDLLINRSLAMVKKSWKAYKKWRKDSSQDPYILALQDLLQSDIDHHLVPIFFLICLSQSDPGSTYDIADPRLKTLVDCVLAKGGKIGVHGSYPSGNDANKLRKEVLQLEKLTGRQNTEGRQHYLRCHLAGSPNTLDRWEDAGICDDYTLGFAERCGFRCGTCHPYPLYDVRNDRETTIIEHPLILMDGTLFDYMKLTVDEAQSLAEKLKKRCLEAEGDFVVLWHNHTTTREFEAYYKTAYQLIMSNE